MVKGTSKFPEFVDNIVVHELNLVEKSLTRLCQSQMPKSKCQMKSQWLNVKTLKFVEYLIFLKNAKRGCEQRGATFSEISICYLTLDRYLNFEIGHLAFIWTLGFVICHYNRSFFCVGYLSFHYSNIPVGMFQPVQSP